MSRKPFPKIPALALALALCLASLSRAATIIWVSDNQNAIDGAAADQGWVNLLRAQGYNVDYRGENDQSPDYRYWRTLNAGKLDELNAADLVIVSRDTSSGSYDDNDEPTLWNSVTTPMILQAAHIYSSNLWRWIDSTSTSSTTANMLAVLPEHPVFDGVALDPNNEIELVNISTNVGDDNVSSDNNYTLIATRSDSDADGIWIAEWETGTEYYLGSGQFAGGPRMYFAAGGQGNGADGLYNLTAEGEKLFLNAVRYMLGSFNPATAQTPYPADKSTVDLADATPLRWGAGETAVRHDVYFAAVFEEVESAEASDTTGVYRGRQYSVIYARPETLELGRAYYWRIDEVEADDTTVHTGPVWSFTVAEYLTVDDFEDYNDFTPDEIWSAWMDGFQIATNGSTAGYPNPDFTGGEHIAETQIVHGGEQAMPLFYDNDNQTVFSEAKMTLDFPRDWTTQGVRALSLWFRGHSPPLGTFTEGPADTYTLTAEGADISGDSDEFHFAWRELTGSGMITARIDSVEDTDGWAKAGVMIRDMLDADSPHAIVAVTPGNGVWFGRREKAGGSSDSVSEPNVAAPQWLRLERSTGGLVGASYSPDGTNWTQLGASQPVVMDAPMYVGLALTSHNPGVACRATFSNVTNNGTGQWVSQDIGLLSNDAQPMYIAVSNDNGITATVYHDDPNAAIMHTWTEWNIDLKDFSDQSIDLTDVNSIAIGFGNRDNPQAGGSGVVYFDDIRLYRPRYIPDKVTPLAADLTGDGLVDFRDLDIISNNWLKGDPFGLTRLAPDEASGDTVDFRDFAVLADEWLEELLWPER